MNQLEQSIERKIRHRVTAIENLGYENEENPFNSYSECEYFLDIAKINAEQSLYTGVGGGNCIIVIIKKVLRKILVQLFGWYLEPKLYQAGVYNKNMICALESVIRTQNKTNRALRRELEQMKCNLNKCSNGLDLDYFAFENKFRGTREDVKNVQKDFLRFYEQVKGTVLDIGCGRGEFLELLGEKGIKAYGIDIYKPFVDYCKTQSLDARMEDALHHMKSLPDNSLEGIMMSHVAEHLTTDYLIDLMKEAQKKLKKGCCFIMQTPNPEALLVYLTFYIDPTHQKPVPYKMLEFLFEQAGYSKVERFDPPQTKFKNIVSQLYEEDTKLNLEVFNYGMNAINECMSGYGDYAVVAYK